MQKFVTLCTEAIWEQPETACTQPLDHDGLHDFEIEIVTND